MISFKQFLEEGLNQPYPFRMKKDSNPQYTKYTATAKLADGRTLTWAARAESKYDNEWGVAFNVDQDVGKTNKGDQFRIFATVLAMSEEFMKKEQPKKISFTSEIKAGEKGSRTNLYKKLVDKFAQRYGYKVHFESLPDWELDAFVLEKK